ncbi:uncharacterized protein LOC131674193 [Phymastichus coffea]|uniref:uncharacterized protein LOC131674193 n=1 Tax=Phymastichus coffea TaxID=108790 RepID=UPI00273ABD1A|nr:uncharacterized protein LOC131674193 [Phymastichus coffea]
MAETAVAQVSKVPVVQTSPKKTKALKKTAGAKKPTTKPNHPPTGEMVNAAIIALKEKKGSSLQAIKKFTSLVATKKSTVATKSTAPNKIKAAPKPKESATKKSADLTKPAAKKPVTMKKVPAKSKTDKPVKQKLQKLRRSLKHPKQRKPQ